MLKVVPEFDKKLKVNLPIGFNFFLDLTLLELPKTCRHADMGLYKENQHLGSAVSLRESDVDLGIMWTWPTNGSTIIENIVSSRLRSICLN